ncbi:MAG: hypothetical protein GXP54_11935 [Deltaproteobacteria bacterium]|nr:hypothetical protein [Deltaproteobacteria bacterium]
MVLAGSQSEAERLQAESLFHLEKVLYILEHAHGKMDVAMSELDKFIKKNHERLEANRRDGRRVMSQMTPDERKSFSKRAMERVKSVKERIDTVVRTFPDPPRIFRKLREIQ